MLLEESIRPDAAFVAAEDWEPCRQGYVDLLELEECLQAFFLGYLDEVPDLSRLWLPINQLIPGKPLLSQLDSNTLHECILQLPERLQGAIASHFQVDEAESLPTYLYSEALMALASLVYKVL